MTHPVVITGLGFVTSLGHHRETVESALRELRHGLAPWNPLGEDPPPGRVAGLLRGFDLASLNPGAWNWPEEFSLDPALVRGLPPHGVYALAALRLSLAEAGLRRDELGDGETGLYCASSGSARMLHHHLGQMEQTAYRRGDPGCIIRSIAGALNFHLAAHLGIRGAGCGFVSACASGAHALGFAFDEVALGRQRRMIVVGAEDLNAESLLPFAAMGALSRNPDPATASRPFDRSRDGFVGTGGATVLILESESSAAARGARAQARMLGWGQACDGHHPAQPHPDGAGLRDAMRRALASSQVTPARVDHVNAHATSTPMGDRAEARAIRAVFEPGEARPAVSSTKALTGHGLSLAGAMEAAFCVLAIDGGFIPGQAHLAEPDEECATLNLPRVTLPIRPGIVLNNSSGFGGANVAHVFSTP